MKAAPMPCGFVRQGVPLKQRLVHYRACPHPACAARVTAFETMKAEFKRNQPKG